MEEEGEEVKKAVILILALLLSLGMFIGCSGAGSDDGSAKTQTFNSRTDYSGIQGYRNWYYLSARDDLSSAEYLIWDDVMCTWRTAKDTNCLIEAHIVHPGQLDQVIRAWKAPADGEAEFTTILQRRPVNRNGVGQDGCFAFVTAGESEDEYIAELAVGALDLDEHHIDGKVSLKEGEMLYFVFNCNGNYTFDQTCWEITINFTRG